MTTTANFQSAPARRVTPRLVITIRQSARQLGVGELTVRRRLKAGQLRGVQIGGSWRLPGPDCARVYELPMECSLHQVANSLDVSDLTIRRWIKDGHIAATKRSRMWVINRVEIEKILGLTNSSTSSAVG